MLLVPTSTVNLTNTLLKTDEEKQSTKKALLNKDFRQAISFAFNREAYAAQLNGKDEQADHP